MTTSNSYEYVIDSYAWIEYFIGGKQALIVEEAINSGKAATPTVVIAEIADKYTKEKSEVLGGRIDFICSKTSVIDLSSHTARKAGTLKSSLRKEYKNNIGLIDVIIYTTALEQNAKVITGDPHFAQFKDVIFLQK